MFDEASDFTHVMTNISKHEICTFCPDSKICKNELLDPEYKEKIIEAEGCIHHTNQVLYSSAKEDQSSSNMVSERAVDSKMSVVSTNINRLKNTDYTSFDCNECEASCSKRIRLSDDVKKVHSDEKPFSCAACTFSSKTKDNLKLNMKRVHLNSD